MGQDPIAEMLSVFLLCMELQLTFLKVTAQIRGLQGKSMHYNISLVIPLQQEKGMVGIDSRVRNPRVKCE